MGPDWQQLWSPINHALCKQAVDRSQIPARLGLTVLLYGMSVTKLTSSIKLIMPDVAAFLGMSLTEGSSSKAFSLSPNTRRLDTAGHRHGKDGPPCSSE